MSFLNEYDAYCQEHGTPERIELLLCDLNAIFRGKWLPGDSADKLDKGAVRLPWSTQAPAIMGNEVSETGMGIVVGDPDGCLIPVPGSLKPAPWLAGHVAQVQVDMADMDGVVSPFSAREVLRSVYERFRAKGLTPVIATELEFYLIQARKDRSDAPTPPSFSPDAQNYDLELLARREAVLGEILSTAKLQGLATDTLIAEYGPGQFEINFHHTDDPMLAAETALLFRRLVRGVAARHGLEATFMAKPYADHPGNGMHVHASVVDDDGNNIFIAKPGEEVSPTLKQAVAGLIDSMRDLQAIFAPHANSYRRFQPNSFAPATPDWGLDNRAAAIRLPETSGPAARLEHRISGADTNPYLVLAAVMGGMLHGLENDPPLPQPLDEASSTPAPPLGHDWVTAVERFASSDVAKTIFGPSREVYAAVKRDEISEILNSIPPAEYKYYMSRL